MKKASRITAFVISIIIATVIILSTLFICEELHHECSGKNCPICTDIEMMANVVKTICTVIIFIAFLYSKIMDALLIVTNRYKYKEINNTLVTLKVKLSD